MKAKTKSIATIIALCLTIALGVIGIFAVKTLNMSVGGNISFMADGLSFEVFAGQFKTTKGDAYTNISSQTGKMQGFVMNTDKTLSDVKTEVDSWENLELAMDDRGDAVLHFSVKNNMQDPLYVIITTSLGTNKNNNMDLLVSSAGKQINSGDTEDFTITFDILDTNINAGLTGFAINVKFENAQGMMQVHNKIDEETGLETKEVEYYYLEMGTYNGEPVRWRYVADENGNAYDGTSKVYSLRGYYALETFVPNKSTFVAKNKYDTNYKHIAEGYTNINANDYGISDARSFLTNLGAGGFKQSLEIKDDDSIYSLISARTMTDLYTAIKSSSSNTTIDSTNTSYSLSLTGEQSVINQSDKFWLMSFKEAQTFFAEDADRAWGNTYYWLRSPYSTYANFSHFVKPDGIINYGFVYGSYPMRACFKI